MHITETGCIQEGTTTMPYDAMEQERTLFLYTLYIQSAGDVCQGVPYEELIDTATLNTASPQPSASADQSTMV